MAMLNKRQPYAIVIGLDSIQGLQAARILARHNIPVIGIAEHINNPYCRTRACEYVLHGSTHDERLIETLCDLGPQLTQRAVLYPCNDLSVLHVSRYRDTLCHWYHIMLPDADTVEMLMDKDSFYAYAQAEGLPIPATYWLHTRTDAAQTAGQVNYPCVLKPAVKTPEWRDHIGQKAFKVTSPEELLRIYDLGAPHVETIIVQDWVEGSDAEQFVCYCYYTQDSVPAATFVARKLRQWPPQVGIGSLRIEVKNETVKDITLRLFDGLQYKGMCFVQIKRDIRTGDYFILEPNIGRPGAGTAVSEAGGVEMHYAMYCDAVGWPLPDHLEQRFVDAKWIHLSADFRSAWHAYRHGEITLREWWQSWQGPKVFVSFSWTDPLPFWGQFFMRQKQNF